MNRKALRSLSSLPVLTAVAALGYGCSTNTVEGLAPAQPAATHVKMDFYHRPLPDIPLPNDIATRYDETSATGRRINAWMVAPTAFESDGIPATFVIGPDGRFLVEQIGSAEWDTPEVIDYLAKLSASPVEKR